MRWPDWMRSAGAVAVMTLALSGFARAGTFEDGIAAYAVEDYATALRLWRPLAGQGDAEAQHNLGLMYAEGRGVPQDYAKALKWFRLAAEQGVVAAQFILGVMYENGLGVPQDDAEAVKWYHKAAGAGSVT